MSSHMLGHLFASCMLGQWTWTSTPDSILGGNSFNGSFYHNILKVRTHRILRQFGPAEPTATKGKGGVQCQHHDGDDDDDDHRRHGEAESSREVTQ